MKISHLDPRVVSNVINWLKALYKTLPNGEIVKMKVQYGKVLENLGMDFDFSVNGDLKITMID